MSNRERNETDEYSDYIDGPEPDSTGLNRGTDPDDDFMDASIHEPSELKLSCESALKQSILKSHSDFCLAHGIKQDLGDGKQIAKERLIGFDRNADSYYSNGGR